MKPKTIITYEMTRTLESGVTEWPKNIRTLREAVDLARESLQWSEYVKIYRRFTTPQPNGGYISGFTHQWHVTKDGVVLCTKHSGRFSR